MKVWNRADHSSDVESNGGKLGMEVAGMGLLSPLVIAATSASVLRLSLLRETPPPWGEVGDLTRFDT